jgi:DNA-directed RNA polymerase subunit RPC12/RpoP
MHNKCKYCGNRFGGERKLTACFRCWELFEDPRGPEYDPETVDISEMRKKHYG